MKLRILAFLAITSLLIYIYIELHPGNDQTVTINFPAGTSARDFARLLQKENVIRVPKAFLLYLRYTGNDKKLKPGQHTFQPGCNYADITAELLKEHIEYRKLTVPEGLIISETEKILVKDGLCSPGSLKMFTSDMFNLPSWSGKSLEGFLFPETYFIEPGEKLPFILKRMTNLFSKNLSKASLNSSTPLSTREAVVLASIIEKEAAIREEAERISGVFHNRLKKKMPLESCATVRYLLGYSKKKLYYKDLKIDSPYNTYLNPGLPPGPICSPGYDSLYAAFHPENHDYLYFVSEGKTHHFSKSLKEHNRWKKKLKQLK